MASMLVGVEGPPPPSPPPMLGWRMKKAKRDGVLGLGGAGDSALGLFNTLPQNGFSSSRSAEGAALNLQHSGIRDRNLSADFPYMSVSLIARR